MSRAAKVAVRITLLVVSVASIELVVFVWHEFSARDHPSAVEAFIACRVRRLAIPSAAREVRNPIAVAPEVLADGRAHFADHCATCHANDGSGNTEIGENLYPKAPDMRKAATQELTDGELFYIIHNGIRFTGMPAWGPEDPAVDQDSWKLVHFIRHIPKLSPDEIREMNAMNPKSPHEMEEKEDIEKFLLGEGEVPPPSHHH